MPLHPFHYTNPLGLVQDAFDGLREVNPASGRVLTDDFNPVEFHDAANRERVRKNLVAGVREL